MPAPLRVLIVADSEADTLLIAGLLERGGLDPVFERVDTAAAMEAALDAHSWNLIISDYSIPGFGGKEMLSICHQRGSDIPFIVVSGVIGEEAAVAMMKAGAHDYIMINDLSRLPSAVKHELRASQERRIRQQTEAHAVYLASLVESCSNAIIGKALDGTVVSWNAGAEQLYGYTAQEMIGRSISVLMPHYRPDGSMGIMDKILRDEQVDGLETVRLRKDGSQVEVLVRVSPVKDAGGRIIGASVVAQDITMRKLEERERLALIEDLTAALTHTSHLKVEKSG